MASALESARRRASQFFWGWLIVASGFSMSANVAHAVLLADERMMWMTAAAAIVPPSVQIAATHSIKLLVRTRASGWSYWTALVMTLVIGMFAFILSFNAISSLAATLGFSGSIFGTRIAAIFPLAIDVSIAHATVCLLSQSSPPSRMLAAPMRSAAVRASNDKVGGSSAVADGASKVNVDPPALAVPPEVTAVVSQSDHSTPVVPTIGGGQAARVAQRPSRALSAVRPAASCVAVGKDAHSAADRPGEEYLALAQALVRNKVTKKDPEVVAVLLADGAAGLGPTAISEKRNVHHSVVTKVLQAAPLHAL